MVQARKLRYGLFTPVIEFSDNITLAMKPSNSRCRLSLLLVFVLAGLGVAALQRRSATEPIHVGSAEVADHAQSVWSPPYPEAAKAKRIEGDVKLRLVINELGNVSELTVLSGDPLLAAAAVPVVRRWNYRPFERGGKRVAVTADVEVPFHPPTGLSEDQEWQQHLQAANSFRRQGRYEEAEREYKAAIATAHKLSDQNLADSLHDLAAFYYRYGRENEALPLMRERLHILEKSRVQNPPEIAYARADLAVLLARSKEFDSAEPLLRSTIPVLEKYKRSATLADTKAEYDKRISMALFGLAIVLENKGDDSEAESLFKRAIALGKPVLPPDDTAVILRNYAAMLQKVGRLQEASAMNAEATTLQLDLAPAPRH